MAPFNIANSSSFSCDTFPCTDPVILGPIQFNWTDTLFTVTFNALNYSYLRCSKPARQLVIDRIMSQDPISPHFYRGVITSLTSYPAICFYFNEDTNVFALRLDDNHQCPDATAESSCDGDAAPLYVELKITGSMGRNTSIDNISPSIPDCTTGFLLYVF